jgi:hypothetical protein
MFYCAVRRFLLIESSSPLEDVPIWGEGLDKWRHLYSEMKALEMAQMREPKKENAN